MENHISPPQEPGMALGPQVCAKEPPFASHGKTLGKHAFPGAHHCQTTAEPVGTLVAAAKTYG